MIFQLQHQNRSDLSDTLLIAQGEPPAGMPKHALGQFFADWKNDVESRHPLPDWHGWLLCDEVSRHFKWARIVASEMRKAGIECSDETERKMIDSEYRSA